MSDSPRYNEPFYATPYSLHQHHLWITATNDQKEVFRILQFRSAIAQMDYNNNGLTIRLERGQVCITIRQLAEEAKVSKKQAEIAILHFKGMDSRGNPLQSCRNHAALLEGQEEGQNERQRKAVYNILLDGYYEKCGTACGTKRETACGTRERQARDTNKEAKKAKMPKQEEESDISIDISSSSPPNPQREKRGGGRKEAYKYPGTISEEAYRFCDKTVKARITCSADIIQSWIDELDGRVDLVEQEIEEVAQLKASGAKIFSAPAFIGARITQIKSSFRPTIERRTESNLEYAKAKLGSIELEGYQRIAYGADFITIKHAEQDFQIFYISPTFREEVEIAIKFLKEHRKKVIHIKEA